MMGIVIQQTIELDLMIGQDWGYLALGYTLGMMYFDTVCHTMRKMANQHL